MFCVYLGMNPSREFPICPCTKLCWVMPRNTELYLYYDILVPSISRDVLLGKGWSLGKGISRDIPDKMSLWPWVIPWQLKSKTQVILRTTLYILVWVWTSNESCNAWCCLRIVSTKLLEGGLWSLNRSHLRHLSSSRSGVTHFATTEIIMIHEICVSDIWLEYRHS